MVASQAGNGGLVQGGEVVVLVTVLVGDIGLLLCHNRGDSLQLVSEQGLLSTALAVL